MGRRIEGLHKWIKENVVGDRGNGYSADFNQNSPKIEGDVNFPEIPDVPSPLEANTTFQTTLKGLFVDILTSYSFECCCRST